MGSRDLNVLAFERLLPAKHIGNRGPLLLIERALVAVLELLASLLCVSLVRHIDTSCSEHLAKEHPLCCSPLALQTWCWDRLLRATQVLSSGRECLSPLALNRSCPHSRFRQFANTEQRAGRSRGHSLGSLPMSGVVSTMGVGEVLQKTCNISAADIARSNIIWTTNSWQLSCTWGPG